MAAAVFVAVTTAVTGIVLRRRVALSPYQSPPRVDGDDRGPRRAVVICVTATVVVLAGLVWVSLGLAHRAAHPAGPIVEVVGHTWWWEDASHLVASALEDVLLCALVFFGSMQDKHYVNITVSAIYGYFVACAWLPLYVLIYWLPRM